VMGSLLEHRVAGGVTRRVYISGDTLTGDHISQLAQRHPRHRRGRHTPRRHPGAVPHRTDGRSSSCRLLRRVQPARAIPVHHDDYAVCRSSLEESERAAADAGLAGLVKPVRRGETISLDPRRPSEDDRQ
jgi:hypothetical protein